MAQEIERKFLPASEGWRGLGEGQRLVQGYLCAEQGRTVRVRLAGEEGFLTVKGAGRGPEGIARTEFEYGIPAADARAMLALCSLPLIEKTRFRIPFQGLVWEVDEFSGVNAGLILLEVELERSDQPIVKPDWVGEEVSADPRYSNAMLARNPFTRWKR